MRTVPARAREASVPEVQRRVLFGRRNVHLWYRLRITLRRACHGVYLIRLPYCQSSRLRPVRPVEKVHAFSSGG